MQRRILPLLAALALAACDKQPAGPVIQQQATGTINQESWTHGSAAQRSKWFSSGFKGGTTDSCDTFTPATP